MTDKKQTAEEWLDMFEEQDEIDSTTDEEIKHIPNDLVLIRKAKQALAMARAEGEEKGRRETAKKVFEELEERYSTLKHEHKGYWREPLDDGWEFTKARFLGKEKEVKQ